MGAEEELDSQVIRRRDLIRLGEEFTAALRPLGDLIDHVKEGNDRFKDGALMFGIITKWLRVAVVLSVLVLMLQITLAVLMWSTLAIQTKVAHQQQKDSAAQAAVAADMRRMVATANELLKRADEADERDSTLAQVTLVPELDPAKAEEAPLKVRITPPVHYDDRGAKKPEHAPAVELPVPMDTIQ